MSNYVLDAYAWIEYFNGTEQGKKVQKIIKEKNNYIYTNVITVAELARSYARNNLSFEEESKGLLILSKIFIVDFKFAEETSRLHAEIKKERKHMSMADVFVLLTAKRLNAKIITGDEDFKGLKEVIMLK